LVYELEVDEVAIEIHAYHHFLQLLDFDSEPVDFNVQVLEHLVELIIVASHGFRADLHVGGKLLLLELLELGRVGLHQELFVADRLEEHVLDHVVHALPLR